MFETWPEAEVAEGTWGFENALPPLWRSPPLQAGLVDVLPAVFTSMYGWEQSLPSPFRAAFMPPAQAEVWPEAYITEGTWGFEQALPPPWKQVPTQATLVDVWPALVVGAYGWEQSLPAPFRAAFLTVSMFEVWPEAEISFGAWGFESALPSLWRALPLQAGLVDVLPAVFTSTYGWEQSLPAPFRAAFMPPAQAEVWPEAFITEGTWGFEQALPPLWRPVPTQAGLVDVWPALVVGAYGWEQSLPAPFRAAFLPVSMFESWPEAEVAEGTWGFEEALPPPWRAAPLQAGLVDVWPAVFTSVYGWEQSLPSLFRAPFQTPAPSEAWPPSANEGVWGFEAALSPQLRFLYTSPQTSEPIPSTITTWGWEFPTPPAARPKVEAYRLIEVFPAMTAPWPVDLGDANLIWRAGRKDSVFDALAALIEEAFYGWENLSPVPRLVIQQARNEDVFPSTPTQIYPWAQDLPSDLRAQLKHIQPTLIDVFPTQPVPTVAPWGSDISTLQAKAGHVVITLDDWWPPIVQPNPLLPGGYKPSSIFEDRYVDRDFINRVEQTIEAIDGELLSLRDEPDDDTTAGYKVAEPDVLPPGWRSGREKAKPEAEPIRHVHYNFASDLDFGVRRRIVGILDRAEQRKVNILGSDAFVTSETARVHGQLVVQGTNAWILRVEGDARLDLAREAVTEGFKLISFDDTSLSFIHRPTYPWKQLYLGAGIGGALVSAGVGLGYLIWGRTPPASAPQAALPKQPTASKQSTAPKQLEAVKAPKPKATSSAKAAKSTKPAKTTKAAKKK
jgi:hypothetical protein